MSVLGSLAAAAGKRACPRCANESALGVLRAARTVVEDEDGEESEDEDAADDTDESASDAPPELLPTPLGAYGLEAWPEATTTLLLHATVWTSGPDGRGAWSR